MTPDIYQADQWHDYFITVGAALAISMNSLLAYMISGAWLLIMGVSEPRSGGREAS